MLIRRTAPVNNVFGNIIDEWNRAIDDNERGNALALDVLENDDQYTVIADMPGVDADSISVQLHEDVLTISSEIHATHNDESANVLVSERRFGKFSRSLRFPVHVNNTAVEADYNNGVLTVIVPKAEEVKPRRINVKVKSK